MVNNIITLRSVYKIKDYHFQPTKQPNGLNWPWVKPTRIGIDGRSEMIMTDAERNMPESAYFIPDDMDIYVTDGTTFDLSDPLQNNMWMSIKDNDLIAPERDAKDANGDFLIDGNKKRYGIAELYIEIPGADSERTVGRRKKIIQAQTWIMQDSFDGRLTKCKLLGKNMKNAPSTDVEDFLYQQAEKSPQTVIDLYTNGDTKLRLLVIDAKERRKIVQKDGVWMYGSVNVGLTDDAIIQYLKNPANKTVFDLLIRDVYPEYAPNTDSEPTGSETETTKSRSTKK